jgi:fumarate reductase subunit C
MNSKNPIDKNYRGFVRQMPANWWLQKRNYTLFIIREFTCVFVGAYALFLLVLAMRRDEPQLFADWIHSPLLIALQIVALPFLLFHSITWINLTPKVLVVWRGEERVSPRLIAAFHHVMWLIVSLVVFWIAMRS